MNTYKGLFLVRVVGEETKLFYLLPEFVNGELCNYCHHFRCIYLGEIKWSNKFFLFPFPCFVFRFPSIFWALPFHISHFVLRSSSKKFPPIPAYYAGQLRLSPLRGLWVATRYICEGQSVDFSLSKHVHSRLSSTRLSCIHQLNSSKNSTIERERAHSSEGLKKCSDCHVFETLLNATVPCLCLGPSTLIGSRLEAERVDLPNWLYLHQK